MQGRVAGELWSTRQMGKGVRVQRWMKDVARVMKDQAKQMEGKMESTEPDVFITGETPNKQMKNQVTYDYRTPT